MLITKEWHKNVNNDSQHLPSTFYCVLVEVLTLAAGTHNLQISIGYTTKVYFLPIIVRSWPGDSWGQLFSSFTFLESFPLALLRRVREAWKVYGGFRAKAGSGMPYFCPHSTGQNSVPWFLVGTGK